MGWILTTDKLPEINKSVLSLVYVDIPQKTQATIFTVLIGPSTPGGPWYQRVPNEINKWVEINPERVLMWSEIESPIQSKNIKTIIDWQHDLPVTIWKYTSYETAKLILTNQSLKFSHFKEFNDVFDCSLDGLYYDCTNVCDHFRNEIPTIVEVLKLNGMKYGVNEINETYQEIQNNKRNASAILCFTLNNNNILMWTHYGNDSKGICFEFDSSLGFETIFPDLQFAMEGEIIYNWEDIINYFEDPNTGLGKVFLNKSIKWEYEDEYRYVALAKPGNYKFNKSFLKGITFGVRCTDDKITDILNICQENEYNNIYFKKARLERFDIIYDDIKINDYIKS